jgi:PAP2 superfamily
MALAGAGVFAVISEQPFIEEPVEEFVSDSSLLSPNADTFLSTSGEGLWLVLAASTQYAVARMLDNESLYADSKRTLRALTLTGISTIALKTVTSDSRPDTGTLDGFPSGHASMSMAFATSLDRTYGHWVGAPAYLLSAGVGLQRVNSRRHDVDDVVFGWALGYLIADSIFTDRQADLSFGRTWSIVPMIEPEVGGLGIRRALEFLVRKDWPEPIASLRDDQPPRLPAY